MIKTTKFMDNFYIFDDGMVRQFLIIGEKEVESGTISVRFRETDETKVFQLDDFIQMISEEIAERR